VHLFFSFRVFVPMLSASLRWLFEEVALHCLFYVADLVALASCRVQRILVNDFFFLNFLSRAACAPTPTGSCTFINASCVTHLRYLTGGCSGSAFVRARTSTSLVHAVRVAVSEELCFFAFRYFSRVTYLAQLVFA